MALWRCVFRCVSSTRTASQHGPHTGLCLLVTTRRSTCAWRCCNATWRAPPWMPSTHCWTLLPRLLLWYGIMLTHGWVLQLTHMACAVYPSEPTLASLAVR